MIVKVHSASYNQSNSTLIQLNDQEFGFETYSRGLNVAVINEITGQKLFCTSFDTFIDQSAAIAFAELIENLPSGRIVAIAVQDDATSNLNHRARKAGESLGSSLINSLSFRDAWAMIGQKGTAPGTAAESFSSDSDITISRSFDLPVENEIRPTIVAISDGNVWENKDVITLNGKEIAIPGGYQRGLNIAVFEPSTLEPIITQSFDLFANPANADAFAELIENLPPGQIVAITIKDDGFWNLSDRAKKACISIGSRLINNLQFRSSWAIIGYKNATPGSVIENLTNSGAVSVKLWIPEITSLNNQWRQKQKLQPTDLQRQNLFGSAVAISGQVALIGARLADTHSNEYAGSAYIFQLENGQWQQKQKLQPGDLHRGNCFGNSVAISGEIAIVGAYFAGSQSNQYAGSAYIFQQENGHWVEKQKLQPQDLQPGDNFGYAVSISGDIAIISAHLAEVAGHKYAGNAYIFQLENGQWVEKQQLQPHDLQSGDSFGSSVAISGHTAIIGARLAHAQNQKYAGSAYIFQLENGQWVEKQKLQPADLQSGDNFGNSVALAAEVAIVGAYGVNAHGRANAGSAYIFQLENAQWIQKQKLQPTDLQRGDSFGTSVAISENQIIIGANGVDTEADPDTGSTYIFQFQNGQWLEKQKLQPADLQRSDSFGYAVAINQQVVIVGAHNAHAQGNPYAGSAYIFEAGVN